MGMRLTIKQVSEKSGLSEYAIRIGIKQGRIPHIRTSGNKGKILIDIELLERYLEQEAVKSTLSVSHKSEIINYGQLRQVMP